MTPQHKENRVQWCRRFISKGEEFWNTVVFSDEKKFNGDGPDGFASYWHDLRTKERIFSKRQNGGFSVMVWGAISLYGVSPIVFMDGRQDSTKYVDVLRHGLLPFSSEVFGEGQGWVFQQDNAPIHTSNFTRTWLSGHSIRTLPWPPKSPDMNIIENVWGVMARMVYARGRHYQNVRELKDAIEEAWSTVGSDLLLKLYKSLPRRMHAVMDARGGATNIRYLFSSRRSYALSRRSFSNVRLSLPLISSAAARDEIPAVLLTSLFTPISHNTRTPNIQQKSRFQVIHFPPQPVSSGPELTTQALNHLEPHAVTPAHRPDFDLSKIRGFVVKCKDYIPKVM
ncbi:unnamed protein product [Chondrus crispus]|uniref:Tc1-like transposase DDE domain-containing protein n=1 Tax=Chondrus crispus TaxID=2769 RepID=R7Q480_CHOCR|nr:unnamed protein product [Chondrus crispus]CDF33332.1 unnamed protein product [Chondrus crispus]|eukprot:XP_005713135.1 unnamed protein product [Chondrus crispus]